MAMHKYRLINYFDTWYNPEDGWQVNNLCEEGEMLISDSVDNKDILSVLIEFGFIRRGVTLEQLEILAYDLDFIEFYATEDDRPIGRLERIYE